MFQTISHCIKYAFISFTEKAVILKQTKICILLYMFHFENAVTHIINKTKTNKEICLFYDSVSLSNSC